MNGEDSLRSTVGGRPRSGKPRRKHVVSIKITEAEKQTMTALYSSPGKGFRVLLNREKEQW